ncbi:GntR family transcriptional regulator [Ovoidimarina sediminis]|uniref:GntR family transcriptional regulator n=1 Tax=Ovoidimarina sediminis TaxID=3079856 RepID=UPI0029128C9F|nr:GntR family transcriptional regulator [Rhodophyticola sp. MJ-SS7]MDU8942498.1 GntR family transcriptional regulator [Rhodophyticola sp. MJ-SS7]
MSIPRVDAIYDVLKAKSIAFAFRPGDRLNEVALARELEASRTPLREALNRLVSEGLVTFRPGEGFFARPLEPKTIYDLYELRVILETAAVRLAVERAGEAELAAFAARHADAEARLKGMTIGEAAEDDEAFHMGIARLTGNAALEARLNGVNEQIRVVRWVDMTKRIRDTKTEHAGMIDALLARDGVGAAALMERHITRRMDQVMDAVREGISHIYMDGSDALAARPAVEAGDAG